jgi:phosphatidylserine decarboxylase
VGARRRLRRIGGFAILLTGLLVLTALLVLLRLSVVTDHMYHALVKDPERTPPAGNVIVAPADGTVLYVKPVRDGVVPEIVKRGVAIPVRDHLKTEPVSPVEDGYLVGIYMNFDSVHVNRVPIGGRVVKRIVHNGPHMDMSPAERRIILRQLVPGWTSLRKAVGLPPFDLEDDADFVLKSARETVVLEDERATPVYVVRIADFYVGKILTWVAEGQEVETGQRLGMITWGSQTDVLFERTPGLELQVQEGQFVYGGETVLATYE